jgi:hypothetical protein
MAADPGGVALTADRWRRPRSSSAASCRGRKARSGQVKRATKEASSAGLLAVPALLTSPWLGLSFVLVGCGIALGPIGRDVREDATTAVVIGAPVLVLGRGVYVEQAVSQLASWDTRPAPQKLGLDHDVSRGSSPTDEPQRPHTRRAGT